VHHFVSSLFPVLSFNVPDCFNVDGLLMTNPRLSVYVTRYQLHGVAMEALLISFEALGVVCDAISADVAETTSEKGECRSC